MLPLRLFLALCFTLWPSMAAAEADASDARAAIARIARAVGASLATCEEDGSCVPAPHSLDLLDRTTGDVGVDSHLPHVAAGYVRLREPGVAAHTVRPPTSPVDLVAPLCERLPYHATAPPARR